MALIRASNNMPQTETTIFSVFSLPFLRSDIPSFHHILFLRNKPIGQFTNKGRELCKDVDTPGKWGFLADILEVAISTGISWKLVRNAGWQNSEENLNLNKGPQPSVCALKVDKSCSRQQASRTLSCFREYLLPNFTQLILLSNEGKGKSSLQCSTPLLNT